jgi:YidC/Oxa1 family membrane protein insertase
VNDRRLLSALALIMVIALLPTILLKRSAPKAGALTRHDSVSTTQASQAAATPVSSPAGTVASKPAGADTAVAALTTASGPADTVVVRSKLYRYAVSTRGGVIVSSRLLHYQSMAESDHRDTLELLPADAGLLGGTLIAGTDTIRLDQINFTASGDSLEAPASLILHGQSGNYTIDLTYQFLADDYEVIGSGKVSGLGPTGGLLLINFGNGFRPVEATAADNAQIGLVTKLEKTSLTLFGKLKPRQMFQQSGPFEWIAVKSKYFVAGLFSYDSSGTTIKPNVVGLQAFPSDTVSRPVRAHVAASIAIPADGAFHWRLYLGPMEYSRLHRMGHDFDDVNPYGWSWLRPVIRPFAVWVRAIFVWMHNALGLGYGMVIILFGLLVRILMWPLSRSSMRSMARMQAVQPILTSLQERYKDNPQVLQQETFKVYKEHKVNPLGGCWPMLLPYPVLVAVFFVLQYSIEVRGVSFLWMTDLSRADPLYLIPILMAASMYAVSRIGQMGLPPNPQAKMMTWMMPVVMLVIFARFASGLNLYYAIQNLTSIPQQWLVMKERRTMQPPPAPAPKKKK